MKVRRKLAGFLSVLFLAVSMVMPVQATANQNQTGSEAVNNARNGVLQVNLSYIDKNSVPHVIQGGTGFLIGDESGAEYMITNYHVVNMDSEVKKAASERFHVDFNDSKNINMQVQVVVKRDVMINATIVNQSSDMDFAILRLEQAIYDRTPLPIDDDDNDLVETMAVYALGFPTAIELVEDTPFYVSSDVNIINGIVSTKTSIDGIKYIRHGATMTEGNSGGPLVNGQGAVVGVNTMGVDDTYFYSLQISEVTSVLNALGITYTSETGGSDDGQEEEPEESKEEPETSEEPEPVAIDKTELSALVNECGAMDLSTYDDASSSVLEAALADGQIALNNALASQEDIDAAATAITDAKNALVKKSGIPLNLLLIVLAAAVVVIIIVIVVMISKKKRIMGDIEPHGNSFIPPKPNPGGGLSGGTVSSGLSSLGGGSGETSILDSGSEETSLLGSDETSLLGGGIPDIAATLVRKKNGEQIQIRKQLFKIGKERVKVDYCISDNNTVSRVHVQITYRDSEYYLTDMKSTNYTSVNGNKLSSGQEVKLHNGDKIKLSDEEFEFRC